MYTIDRINRLQRHFNLAPVIGYVGLDAHAVINNLFRRYEMAIGFSVGQEVKSRKSAIRLPQCGIPFDYVGARLARLESLVFGAAPTPSICEERHQDDAEGPWPAPSTSIAPLTGTFSFWLGEMG